MMWKADILKREGKELKIFTLDLGNRFQIQVLNGWIHNPGRWVMHCALFNIEAKELPTENEDAAKDLAVAMIQAIVSSLQVKLDEYYDNQNPEP